MEAGAVGNCPALLLMVALKFIPIEVALKFIPSEPVATLSGPDPTEKYSATVDVMVWSKAGGKVRKLHLGAPDALPVRKGDQVKITAQVEPAGYLYLFWIDSDGDVAPLYPWEPDQWGTRPAKEAPATHLELPPGDEGFTIASDKQAGMETLMLLVCDTPLPAADDAVLRKLLKGKEQRPVQSSQAAVWFENGRVVENDPNRQRSSFKIEAIDDPVLRLQKMLREKLQPLSRCTAAVSFARQGK